VLLELDDRSVLVMDDRAQTIWRVTRGVRRGHSRSIAPMESFDALARLVSLAALSAVIEAARGHDISRRDAHGRSLLHHAASGANDAVCRWLLEQRVDADARDDRRRSAADFVSRGDPSCDPAEVLAWRSLHTVLEEAERTARGAVVVEGFPADLSTDGVREWALRRLGSLARQGGGQRTIRCVAAAREGDGWRFEGSVRSEYAGANPAHDPPWAQEEAVALSLDADGWVRPGQGTTPSACGCCPTRPGV